MCSIITFNLTLGSYTTLNQSICNNQSTSVGSHTYKTQGTYYDTLINYVGCDSFITLHLTVKPTSSSNNYKTICSNQSISIGSHIYKTSGTYYDTLVNSVGCDSFITLHLIVKSTTNKTINRTICSNQNVKIGTHTYNITGNYFDTLINYLGCDSFVTLNLFVKPISNYSFSKTICSNQPFSFNNHQLFSSGIYHDTLINYLGCDSIITLNLTAKPISNYSYIKKLCSFQTYSFNNHVLNLSGTYHDTLINQTGCDSFITLHLVVLPDSVILNKFLCPGYSFNFNGTIINIPGTYRDTLINQLGCDSIVILHLKNGITSSSNLVATVCSNYPFQVGNKFYNQSGIYFDTLTNYLGCDSFITLHLTVNPVSNSILQKSICKNNPYYFHKQWLNITGAYFDTLNNYLGCDSIISLYLNVADTSLTILQSTICNHQSFNFHHQTLTKSGIYFDTLKNQSGCDSILQLQLTVIPSSSVIINESVCSNKPYQFNKKLIDSSGIYFDTIQNYRGCDSIITLQIRMYPQHPIVKNVLGRLTAYGSGYEKVTWINCDNMKPLSTANPYEAYKSGNYAIIVEQNNCKDTSDCQYVDINCKLLAMPTPAKEDIQVQIKCGDKSFHIELIDVLGRKIFQDDIEFQNEFILFRNGLSSGVYFLYLYNEHAVKMVQKVVWE